MEVFLALAVLVSRPILVSTAGIRQEDGARMCRSGTWGLHEGPFGVEIYFDVTKVGESAKYTYIDR